MQKTEKNDGNQGDPINMVEIQEYHEPISEGADKQGHATPDRSFGINPKMDRWAAERGLGHWSCVFPTSNRAWVRKDGREYYYTDRNLRLEYVLKLIDEKAPIKNEPNLVLGDCMVCGAPATQFRRDINRLPCSNIQDYVEYEAGPVGLYCDKCASVLCA